MPHSACIAVLRVGAMLEEKLSPSAADSPSVSAWMLDWMSGSGAAVVAALVFVAAVCACVAFFLYRAARGRAEDTAGTQQNRVAESTEGSDDAGSEECETDSSDSLIHQTPSELLEEQEHHSRDAAHEKLNEPTDFPTNFVTDMSETHGPDFLDDCESQVKRENIVRDAIESIKMEADFMDYRCKDGKLVENELKDCDTEESEAELHGDVDEPSETESAQEIMEAKNITVHKCQSVDDLLDSTLLAQEIMNKPSETELLHEPVLVSLNTGSHLEDDREETKLSDEAVKGFEKSLDDFPQVQEFGCCYDEQSDLLSCSLEKSEAMDDPVKSHPVFPSNVNGLVIPVENSRYDLQDSKYDPQQNYLGFTVLSLPSDPTGQVQQKLESTVSAPVDMNCDKNEINIMEAIMDSNEWLSTGPPDTRDLPWLTQTQSTTSYGFNSNTSTVTPAASNTIDTSWLSQTSSASFGNVTRSYQGADNLRVTSDTVISVAVDEEDFLSKKVAAVSPMPQMVQVSFRVHYVTHSSSQLLAVTGNQKELGAWEGFVPLQRVEDWFWVNTIAIPMESQVEWKFVLVEDGKIRRWEECGNRHLVVTGHDEEIYLDKSWGYF